MQCCLIQYHCPLSSLISFHPLILTHILIKERLFDACEHLQKKPQQWEDISGCTYPELTLIYAYLQVVYAVAVCLKFLFGKGCHGTVELCKQGGAVMGQGTGYGHSI